MLRSCVSHSILSYINKEVRFFLRFSAFVAFLLLLLLLLFCFCGFSASAAFLLLLLFCFGSWQLFSFLFLFLLVRLFALQRRNQTRKEGSKEASKQARLTFGSGVLLGERCPPPTPYEGIVRIM